MDGFQVKGIEFLPTKEHRPPPGRVGLLAYRRENGLDLWTGKPLSRHRWEQDEDDEPVVVLPPPIVSQTPSDRALAVLERFRSRVRVTMTIEVED